MFGLRLLLWYQKPEDVEYLFELGQTSMIRKKEVNREDLVGLSHMV